MDVIEVGRPASFVVEPAASRMDAIRRQVAPRWVVSHGRVIAERDPSPVRLQWHNQQHRIDLIRAADDGAVTWRDARIEREACTK